MSRTRPNEARPNVGRIDQTALLALVAGSVAQSTDLGDFMSLKKSLREAVKKDPLDALIVTVLGGSFLFYLAEKDDNPKVQTPWDALVYVSTCLSVGYADIFARTPAGKAIATAIMTVGPALAAKALDPAADELPEDLAPKALAVQEAMVSKLDAILGELKAQKAA
jgi:hypothetical protein